MAERPEVRRLMDALEAAGGPSIRGVLLFGSQLVRATPSPHSAWDLVVIVDDYRAFHRHLVAAGHHRRPAWLLSLLARVLAPSVTAFDPGAGAPLAKCAIVSWPHFLRALGPRARDHFLKGRMVQKVAVLGARDRSVEEAIEGALAAARRDVLRWAGPWLDPVVTPETLALRMLEVSYGGEVRPESSDRVREVFEAQREFLIEAYGDVLERASETGQVVPLGDGRYRIADPPGPWKRTRIAFYFLRSKVRATARWLKHVLTFNDWLTYIQRKVERRTGMTVPITPWERRLPLLLLWPKVIRVVRQRDAFRDHERLEGGEPSSGEGPGGEGRGS